MLCFFQEITAGFVVPLIGIWESNSWRNEATKSNSLSKDQTNLTSKLLITLVVCLVVSSNYYVVVGLMHMTMCMVFCGLAYIRDAVMTFDGVFFLQGLFDAMNFSFHDLFRFVCFFPPLFFPFHIHIFENVVLMYIFYDYFFSFQASIPDAMFLLCYFSVTSICLVIF